MFLKTRLVTLGVIFLLLAGCGGGGCRDPRAFTVADEWHRDAPSEFVLAGDTKELSREEFAAVPHDKAAPVLAKLERAPWQKLSAQEVQELIGRPLGHARGKGDFYLLRGVYLNEGTGGFDISYRDDAVCVHHSCLGRRPVPMKRRALIARLPFQPRELYVGCSMAE